MEKIAIFSNWKAIGYQLSQCLLGGTDGPDPGTSEAPEAYCEAEDPVSELAPGAYWEPEAGIEVTTEPSGTCWLAGISDPETGEAGEAGEAEDPETGSDPSGPEAPDP